MPRPRGDYERVIRNVIIAKKDAPACDVDSRYFLQKHFSVALALEDRAAERRCSPGKEPGGDLIEERLEQMEVPAIDKRDAKRRIAKRLGGAQAAKAAADDDDVRTRCHRSFPKTG